WLYLGRRRILDRRFGFEHGIEAFQGCRATLPEVYDVAEGYQVPDHPLQIEDEGRKIARRDLSAGGHRNTDGYDDHKAQADKERGERPHAGSEFYEPQLLLGVVEIQLLTALDLGLFLRVGTVDAHPGQILLRTRRDIRKKALDHLKTLMYLAAEVLDRYRNKRQRDEHYERELYRNVQHYRQRDRESEDRLDRV